MTTAEIMRLTRGEDWGTGQLEEGDHGPVDLKEHQRVLTELGALEQRSVSS